MAPKAVPTIAIAAHALTVMPADRSVGFSAPTEPWSGRTAFAGDAPQMAHGIEIVPADQVNEIDLAADRQAAKSGHLVDASLVTPADAAERGQASVARSSGTSFSEWLYGKFADALVTSALAIRSLFH